MCCLPIFGIRSLYFRAPHNTLLQERLLFFHLLSVEPYEGPWNTEKSLSLTVHLSVLISAFLLLSLSPLQHLHSQSWLQGAWRRNQNSALICLSVEHLVGSMVCVPEMDVMVVHFPSPEFGIIKGGIPPFIWESKSLEPNISSDFMDAQTRKSLMERNLEGAEDGQIALGSLLDYF